MSMQAKLIAHLADVLDVPVASEVPESRPARMVCLSRTGGGRTRFVETPRFTVDAWGTSDLDAADLLDVACDALVWAPDSIDELVRVGVSSSYRSDVDGAHRWSATIEVLANLI